MFSFVINNNTILFLVASIFIFPPFHLLFIFSIMALPEWLEHLVKIINRLALVIFELIMHIVSHPIILFLISIFLIKNAS